MARVAPAFDAAGLHSDGMRDGDVINLDVGAIMAHRPEVSAALGEAMAQLRTTGTIGPRLAELLRLRIAFHNQCRSCMSLRYADAVDDGLTEDLVCSLEQPYEAPDLTDADRAALRFADLFATDHLRIDDAVYDELRQHFSEDQLVELGLLCAIALGIGRLAATWHVVEHVPDALQASGPVGPWHTSGAIAGV
jgi:alkylhydroperoxidase family enzyme